MNKGRGARQRCQVREPGGVHELGLTSFAAMALSGSGRSHMKNSEPPPHPPVLKGPDDLYPFSTLDFKPDDIKNTREGILGPLSIFAPHSLEEGNLEISQEAGRPSTPINDEIKRAPSNFNTLVKHIRRRISARPDLPHMSEDDQKELAGIIIGELTVTWPHLRSPVDHPLLSGEDNKELQRRVIVQIVLGCDRLFHEHVDKLQVLNRRGIFSGTANMTRLKAQLALNTRNLLNLSSLRRKILDELKVEKKIEKAINDHETAPKNLSFRTIGDATRLVNGMRLDAYQGDFNPEIQELLSKMPSLDTSDLQNIIASLPILQRQLVQQHEIKSNSPEIQNSGEDADTRSEKDLVIRKTQRAMSMPRIGPHEKLLDEIMHGLPEDERIQNKLQSVTDDKVKVTFAKHAAPAKRVMKTLTPREDLAHLMERNQDDAMLQQSGDEEADLPPLIRALPRNAKHDEKHVLLMKQLQELEERENARIEAETIDVQEPKYIQPETVTTKVPNKMTVKTSDIRVSDRVCLSSITVQGHETVYNDLIDEISAEDVKKLDSNLFLGEEIKEVYAEIMKTVPTDHLRLEQDNLIEPAAEAVNLSATFASSTLRGRKQERIINPNLHHSMEPPWGEHSVTTWANMPQYMGHTETAATGELPQPATAATGEEGPPLQDFMARTYASWLMWWKNTINSDDYMKYLSTQETDYLGVVFHFYNSDGEDEDEDDDDESKVKQASRIQALHEREAKLTELRAQKETYEPGYWNANSVLLGGLGKDPLLGDEFVDDEKSQTNSVTNAPKRTARAGTTVVPLSLMQATMQTAEGGRISARNTEVESAKGAQTRTQSVGSRGVSRNTTKSKRPSGPTPQDRLEKVWTALQMPDSLRLDMAIKYSSDAYFSKMDKAITSWEEITEVINKRESLLAELEAFESTASDPNRFFEKGPRGSSVARLDEAKTRSNLYRKIDSLDEKISHMIRILQEVFMDEVTFKGRPYIEKMKWDRVEMLYWLQEERKQAILDMRPPHSHLPKTHLEPIATATPPIMTAQPT